MSEEVKEQPKLSMKVLDTKIAALQAEVDALKGTQTVEDGSQGLDDRIAAIEAKLTDIDAEIMASLPVTAGAIDGLILRITAIEAKLEALAPSTGLITPDGIDLDALLAALRPKAGAMWRAPA